MPEMFSSSSEACEAMARGTGVSTAEIAISLR